VIIEAIIETWSKEDELRALLDATTARAEAAEATIWAVGQAMEIAIPKYAAYYAEVIARGDAPESFENWLDNTKKQAQAQAVQP
jgi:hypothetical protein